MANCIVQLGIVSIAKIILRKWNTASWKIRPAKFDSWLGLIQEVTYLPVGGSNSSKNNNRIHVDVLSTSANHMYIIHVKNNYANII